MREKFLRIRLTDDELAVLEAKAGEAPVSTWGRAVLLAAAAKPTLLQDSEPVSEVAPMLAADVAPQGLASPVSETTPAGTAREGTFQLCPSCTRLRWANCDSCLRRLRPPPKD
jgi:hypothetical protein